MIISAAATARRDQAGGVGPTREAAGLATRTTTVLGVVTRSVGVCGQNQARPSSIFCLMLPHSPPPPNSLSLCLFHHTRFPSHTHSSSLPHSVTVLDLLISSPTFLFIPPLFRTTSILHLLTPSLTTTFLTLSPHFFTPSSSFPHWCHFHSLTPAGPSAPYRPPTITTGAQPSPAH